jgi:hypothetical protein
MALTRLNYDSIRTPIFVNPNQITENIVVSSTENAGSFGPVEIMPGYTVELSANSTWSIV